MKARGFGMTPPYKVEFKLSQRRLCHVLLRQDFCAMLVGD
jgi:hypothetical protein